MTRVKLEGKYFDDWHVLEYVGNKKYLCECSCGNKKIVSTYSLTSRKSTSCGHKTTDKIKYDITNQTFGELKALVYIQNENMWICECSCGRIVNKHSKKLRCGSSLICGQMHNKPLSEQDILEIKEFMDGNPGVILENKACVKMKPKSETSLSGAIQSKKGRAKTDMMYKWFNDVQVIEKVGDDRYLCRCVCGVLREIRGYSLRHMPDKGYYKCRHVAIIGKEFGLLKVMDRNGTVCICDCKCGNKNIKVNIGNLLNESTKSCGCLRKPEYSKEEFITIINNYQIEHGCKPQPLELINLNMIGLKMTALYENIHGYGLESYFDMGSSVVEKEIAAICGKCIRNDRTVLEGMELDIYVADKGIAIEVNGAYWHSDLYKGELYHQNKTILCASKNIQLIHIFDFEWRDDTLKKKLESYIRQLVHGPEKVLYARNLEVKEISNADAVKFCNEFHIQNGVNTKVSVGLYDKGQGLVSVMCFGYPRYGGGYDYELIRYCTRAGIGITGGAEKLFKYFIRNHDPLSIMTYADISKFTGNVYTRRLGFEPMDPAVTEPGYVWVNGKQVMKRHQTQKRVLVEKGWGVESETEDAIMRNHGYAKVYNSGNIRLMWNKEKKKGACSNERRQ